MLKIWAGSVNNKTLNLLTYILLGVGCFYLLSPFLPNITYLFLRPQVFSVSQNIPELNKVLLRGSEPAGVGAIAFSTQKAQENRLTINAIGVNGQIHEGDNQALLKEGIWRLPWTGTPAAGGNTVIVAHRFLKTSGPETFYHLDKLKNGDRVTLRWQGMLYEYEVFSSEVVSASATEIEYPTSDSILTLYTCTPLWSSKDRLVVRAKLLPY